MSPLTKEQLLKLVKRLGFKIEKSSDVAGRSSIWVEKRTIYLHNDGTTYSLAHEIAHALCTVGEIESSQERWAFNLFGTISKSTNTFKEELVASIVGLKLSGATPENKKGFVASVRSYLFASKGLFGTTCLTKADGKIVQNAVKNRLFLANFLLRQRPKTLTQRLKEVFFP